MRKITFADAFRNILAGHKIAVRVVHNQEMDMDQEQVPTWCDEELHRLRGAWRPAIAYFYGKVIHYVWSSQGLDFQIRELPA